MQSVFSSDQLVASVFKRYAQKKLTPEFIRNETGFLCDALGIPHVGDPGRKVRAFEAKRAVQKDAEKATYYWYDPNECLDSEFTRLENLYSHPSFDSNVYRVVKFLDALKDKMVKDPLFADKIMAQLKMNV